MSNKLGPCLGAPESVNWWHALARSTNRDALRRIGMRPSRLPHIEMSARVKSADRPDRRSPCAVRPRRFGRAERRLGERSPRPSSSLSVTSRSACLWVNVSTVRCDWSCEASAGRCPRCSWIRHPAAETDNYCKPYRTHDTRHVRALPTPGRHVYSCSFDLPARGPYRCVWHPRTRV